MNGRAETLRARQGAPIDKAALRAFHGWMGIAITP
jgi:hypothetical protein